MRSLILAKRRNSEPELAFYARCGRSRKISVIQSKPPVWLRPGIRRENLKVTFLDFAWIDGYCHLTAQESRARAQKRLVNKFMLERNYEWKAVMCPILRPDASHPEHRKSSETAFRSRQPHVLVLGVQFGSAVTGIKHDLLSAARRSLGFQSLEKNVNRGHSRQPPWTLPAPRQRVKIRKYLQGNDFRVRSRKEELKC